MINRLLLSMLVLFIFSTTAIAATNPEAKGFNLTPDQIGDMNSTDRNAYFTAMRNAKDRAAKIKSEQIPESLSLGISMLDDLNTNGLSEKLGAIADGIVNFCTRLGIGVEKFIGSKIGIAITIGIIYKMGMFGSIVDTIVLGFGIIFFSYVLMACNTNKKIKLKDSKLNEKGDMVPVTEREVTVPRFNALFTYFSAKDGEDESHSIEEIGYYRIFASLFSLVMILIMVFFI